jgi:hypothetical protein
MFISLSHGRMRVRVRVSYRVRCGYGGTLILNILGYGYGNIYNIFLNKNKYIIHKKIKK